MTLIDSCSEGLFFRKDLRCFNLHECAIHSRSSHEKLFVAFVIGLVRGSVAGDVLHELAAAFWPLALDHAYAAGRHGTGFEAEDAAFAHLDVRAEPVGAKHSSRGVEGK